MDLVIATRQEGRCLVVEVIGDIDVHTAPQLREHLVEMVRSGHHHLLVDLGAVTLLDSTGLGCLVGLLQRVRALDGSFRLVCSERRGLKIFTITGLDRVFSLHLTIADALAAADIELFASAR